MHTQEYFPLLYGNVLLAHSELSLWNIFSPKFYVALTVTSFLISLLILLFEWWYYSKCGMSFIEQFSFTYLSALFGNGNGNGHDVGDEDFLTLENRHMLQGHISLECKVWRNPMSLFRGGEYKRLTDETKKEPLTFYDMNLSAQDHQTFFTCESDTGKEDMEIMMTAWREREPKERIKSAHRALEINAECIPAMILLAEEEMPTVWQAEQLLLEALPLAEVQYRKSLASMHHQPTTPLQELQHRRDLNTYIYIRRRLAMCARKLGRLREAIKMMRDLIKEYPTLNLFNIHENLIEALLEVNAYADVHALLTKYDDINLPKSATICYTAALLKVRGVSEKFSPDLVSKRGLSNYEMIAVEAIYRAVEFNPHVPKYLLEAKELIFPPEHVLKRGDSEAIAYVFDHMRHWKRIEGALLLLDCTWKGTFRIIPYPLEKGNLFYPYPTCTECTDRELLPDYHDVSVYPKKDLPFFIRFLASLCTVSAMVAFISYQYPDLMNYGARALLNFMLQIGNIIVREFEQMVPAWLQQPTLTQL